MTAPAVPLRVTYLNPSGSLGGGERSLLTLIAAVRRTGLDYAPSVILLQEGPLAGELKAMKVPVRVVPMSEGLAELGDSGIKAQVSGGATVWRGLLRNLPALTRLGCRLRRAVWESSPAIIHSNGLKTHLLSPLLRLGRSDPLPIIWHVRDFLSARRFAASATHVASSIVRQLLVIANSRAVAEDARKLVGPGVRVRAIHNAVDVERFCPGERGVSSTSGVSAATEGQDESGGLRAAAKGVVRVGLIATYARWKGQDCFIDAIARLPPGVRAAARFFIVGGPIYRTAGSQWTREELQERARRAGVTDSVELVPFQPDPVPVYRSLDVVVHASTEPEPFGLTIVEAMACGRAVIVSVGGGAAELFEDGVNAVGVPPGDVDRLAEAMGRLIRDESLRRRLGAAAREHAAAQFGLERFGREIVQVYRALSSGRDRA